MQAIPKKTVSQKNLPMFKLIYHCNGGTVVLPDMVLCDRRDGGHLVVNPPRTVSERSELGPLEIANWGLLVAATGRAMLKILPHLQGGCLNYWEAGNWGLNDAAFPIGPSPCLSAAVCICICICICIFWVVAATLCIPIGVGASPRSFQTSHRRRTGLPTSCHWTRWSALLWCGA